MPDAAEWLQHRPTASVAALFKSRGDCGVWSDRLSTPSLERCWAPGLLAETIDSGVTPSNSGSRNLTSTGVLQHSLGMSRVFASLRDIDVSRSEAIAVERQSEVLKRLRDDGVVRVDTLARDLDVSLATIRRDLLELERQGRATRVFGGAVVSEDLAYAPRTRSHADEKRRIGQRAASLVSPGETVALDPGTTVVAVAECLRTAGRLTIATNSVAAALVLEGAPEVTTIVTGGIYDAVTRSVSGSLVEAFYETHRVDKLFIGAGSLGLDGLRDSNVAALNAKRAAIQSANQTIVVADHSKFERSALVLVADWSDIAVLITTEGAPVEALETIRSRGVEVIVA